MNYGEMTYQEIHDAAQQGWLAVVPTGCIEQGGPHLTVDNDTWFVDAVCRAASGRSVTRSTPSSFTR